MPHCWKSLEPLEPSLRRFLSTRCRDEAELDDVLQDTFLRAARYRATLKDPTKLRSWAFRIAANALADRIRREARFVRVPEHEQSLEELTDEELVPEPELFEIDGVSEAREDVLAVLASALERLRARDRRLIESFYGGAGSCRETAASCSLPEEVVKVRLYRARTRLRRDVSREVARRRLDRDLTWAQR